MIFPYDGHNLKDTITDYEKDIDANKLIINYLNSDVKELPLTKENEQKTIDEMFKQAQEFTKDSNTQEKETYSLIVGSVLFLNAIKDISLLFSTSANYKDILDIILRAISLTLGIYFIGDYVFQRKKTSEIKKYSIYLSIKDELEKNLNNDQICNVIGDDETLDINSINYYSLKDLIKIKKILETSKQKEATLTKKIGK